MEIEVGLQSNCSDLVAHLGTVTDQGLQKIIKKVKEKLGLKVVLEVHPNDFLRTHVIPLEPHDISRLTVNALQGSEMSGVDKLVTLLPLLVKHKVKHNGALYPTFTIVDETVKAGLRKHVPPHVILNKGDGYVAETEVVIKVSSAGTVKDFPIFTAVRKLFKKDWHVHDGGSELDYEEWLEKHKD